MKKTKKVKKKFNIKFLKICLILNFETYWKFASHKKIFKIENYFF